MKAFKADDGNWYVCNASGDVIAGPFDDEGQALDWIEHNRPSPPRPRMRP
jgi:hypothetical protein